MNSHPDGRQGTERLLQLGNLPRGARVLDMGAGAGDSFFVMEELGLVPYGIDLVPRGERVEKGNFLHCPYPDGSFDGVLSQCAFFVSGNVEKAFTEAGRLLKKGGRLMLSDVCFEPWEGYIKNGGLRLLYSQDLTSLWQEYYIEKIWRGEEVPIIKGKKCRYLAIICEKE